MLTPISPAGFIGTTQPTYTWAPAPGATWYYLWVNDSTGPKVAVWVLAVTAVCANVNTNCTATPTIPLASGAGRWWVRPWNKVTGYQPWSTGLDFVVP